MPFHAGSPRTNPLVRTRAIRQSRFGGDRRRLSICLALLLISLAIADAPLAIADDRPFRPDIYHFDIGSVRLIHGKTGRAGLHFRLAPGWKTYWRSPGISGFAAEFDWSASRNLARAQVQWPFPSRFRDDFGSFAGYAGELVLPIDYDPVRDDKPVHLSVELDFGVCNTLCLPLRASIAAQSDTEITASERANAERLIDRFHRHVPHIVPSGDDQKLIDRFHRHVPHIVPSGDDQNTHWLAGIELLRLHASQLPAPISIADHTDAAGSLYPQDLLVLRIDYAESASPAPRFATAFLEWNRRELAFLTHARIRESEFHVFHESMPPTCQPPSPCDRYRITLAIPDRQSLVRTVVYPRSTARASEAEPVSHLGRRAARFFP